MNKIKIKINGFDESSQSLLVSFASDKTKNEDPSDYPSIAFQPYKMWPDLDMDNVEEVKKRIALAGIHHVQMQAMEEEFTSDARRSKILKSLVGDTQEYSVVELTTVKYETPFQTV